MLNENQTDVLKELINVYIGKAASLLSEMANQRIILAVPDIEVLNVNELDDNSSSSRLLFSPGHVVSSSLKFGHDFSGRAFLIFPASEAKTLVDACMGEYIPDSDENASTNLEDTDFDVLKEISNVILNSVIGEFGNILETKLEFSLPEVELIFVSETEQKIFIQGNIYVLVLHTSFKFADAKVEGALLLALGMNSLSMVISKIDKILGELDE
jgi:chemotaxis protein CheC